MKIYIKREAAWVSFRMFARYYWARLLRYLWWDFIKVGLRQEFDDGVSVGRYSLFNALRLSRSGDKRYYFRGFVFVIDNRSLR